MGETPFQKKMGLRGRFWMCWDRRGLGPAPRLCWLYLKPYPTTPPGQCGGPGGVLAALLPGLAGVWWEIAFFL